MEVMDVINEIETNNNPFQDGLDYYMDCIVNVNNVRTRCEQVVLSNAIWMTLAEMGFRFCLNFEEVSGSLGFSSMKWNP